MLATAGRIFNESSQSSQPPRIDNPKHPEDVARAGDDPLASADPVSQVVSGRNMAGVYAELNLQPAPTWELGLGLRADLWLTGSLHEQAIEPRTTITYHPTAASDVYAAFGLAYQPAVFPIPVPGLADIVLDHGLQRAVQTEVGYRRDFGDALRIETDVFFNHYTGMLFFESAFDCSDRGDREGSMCNGSGFPRASSDAYGWEVFLKRPAQHRISGWISYTLGRSTAESDAGRTFIPQTDVRHYGTAVLQIDLGKRWKLGLRGFFRSGRVPFERSLYYPDHRLPGFARADAMLSNRWPTSWGHMRLSFEFFNFTLSREAVSFQCNPDVETHQVACKTEYAPALFFPNISLRAEL
jgi:hypothetical protein